MADQPALFADKAPEVPSATPAPVEETTSILVGEGRKYKSNEELAKAYLSADDFIEKLKAENAKLREEFGREKTRAETLDKLVARSNLSQPEQSYAPQQNQGQELSAEQIARIVRQEITGQETTKTRQANLVKAEALLKQKFGDKAPEVFKSKASNDTLQKALTDLAAVSPEEFLKLFEQAATQPVASQADTGNTHNTAAVGDPNNAGRAMDPGTKEFYEQLRKKDRSKYYSHAVQLQMTRAAESDPDKFFGRKR